MIKHALRFFPIVLSALIITGCSAMANSLKSEKDYFIGMQYSSDYTDRAKLKDYASITGVSIYSPGDGYAMYPVKVSSKDSQPTIHMVLVDERLEIVASVVFIDMYPESDGTIPYKEYENENFRYRDFIDKTAKKVSIKNGIVKYSDDAIEFRSYGLLTGASSKENNIEVTRKTNNTQAQTKYKDNESLLRKIKYNNREETERDYNSESSVQINKCVNISLSTKRKDSLVSSAIIAINTCILEKKIGKTSETGGKIIKASENVFTTTMGVFFGVVLFPITIPALLFFWGTSHS